MDSPVPFITFAGGKLFRTESSVTVAGQRVPTEFYWPVQLTIPISNRTPCTKERRYSDGLRTISQNSRTSCDISRIFSALILTPELRLVFAPRRVSTGGPGMLLLTPLADHLPHETAHQWWGDLVSWRSYRDQWLSEGFAEYSQALVPIPAVTSRSEHESQDIRKAMIRDNAARASANRTGYSHKGGWPTWVRLLSGTVWKLAKL